MNTRDKKKLRELVKDRCGHIKEPYTFEQLFALIESNWYRAEDVLQHILVALEKHIEESKPKQSSKPKALIELGEHEYIETAYAIGDAVRPLAKVLIVDSKKNCFRAVYINRESMTPNMESQLPISAMMHCIMSNAALALSKRKFKK